MTCCSTTTATTTTAAATTAAATTTITTTTAAAAATTATAFTALLLHRAESSALCHSSTSQLGLDTPLSAQDNYHIQKHMAPGPYRSAYGVCRIDG